MRLAATIRLCDAFGANVLLWVQVQNVHSVVHANAVRVFEHDVVKARRTNNGVGGTRWDAFFLALRVCERGCFIFFCFLCVIGEAQPEILETKTVSTLHVQEGRMHRLLPAVTGVVQSYVFPCLRMCKVCGHSAEAYQTGLETIIERAEAAVPVTKICTCGAVTVHALGGARHVFTCHCTQCATHTKTINGRAPTWTAVSRNMCTISGVYTSYSSSSLGRRGVCQACNDALFMDYLAMNTFYVANSHPSPPIEGGRFIADADIFWKDRKPDAQFTAPIQYEGMPLGTMGFVADPGRKLADLEALRGHKYFGRSAIR